MQVALSKKKKDPTLAKREKALIKRLDLLDSDLGELTFRWGLLDSVRLENRRDWMDPKFDVKPVLEKLFSSAACAALRELKVGVIRWDEHEEDLQTLFEVAGQQLLTLWFGSEDHGADATVNDLEPLLGAKAFPHLKHLGLANAEFAPDIAQALPKSKLAPQLESLDLSMGTLDDSHVAGLVAGVKAFKKLKSLDVRENFFTKAGIAQLQKALPNVDGEEQKTPWEDDPNARYVSVSE